MDSIDRYLKLAKKTNSKFIIHDSNTKEDFIILSLDEYEDLVEQEKMVNNILERKEENESVPSSNFFDEEEVEDKIDFLDEEVEKVNKDIALWYSEEKDEEVGNLDIKKEREFLLEKKVEDFEVKSKNENIKSKESTDWHSMANVISKRLGRNAELEYDEIMDVENKSLESIDINGIKLDDPIEKEKGEPIFYEESV
ncbi:MAG: hypothetical protein L3J07_03150 [Candidatus Magasanikbacteria bacterium]|nr:hypothetical protein [Candidatus Magasanikbacteria bacterium]